MTDRVRVICILNSLVCEKVSIGLVGVSTKKTDKDKTARCTANRESFHAVHRLYDWHCHSLRAKFGKICFLFLFLFLFSLHRHRMSSFAALLRQIERSPVDVLLKGAKLTLETTPDDARPLAFGRFLFPFPDLSCQSYLVCTISCIAAFVLSSLFWLKFSVSFILCFNGLWTIFFDRCLFSSTCFVVVVGMYDFVLVLLFS